MYGSTIGSYGMMDPNMYYQNMYAHSALFNNDDSAFGLMPAFGGSFTGMPFGNAGAYGGMYGFGGPGSEVMNMSQADFLKYQEGISDYNRQRQVRDKYADKNATFRANAGEDAISTRIGVLSRKIADNDQDNVAVEYNKLCKEIEKALIGAQVNPEDITPQKINGFAIRLYQQQTGKNLTDDLVNNSNGSFIHGMKEGAFFGLGSAFTSKRTYLDNLTEITGELPEKNEKTYEALGAILSGALTGSAAFLAAKFGLKSVARAFSSKSRIAWGLVGSAIAGGSIAGLGGLMASKKKVSEAYHAAAG